MNTILQLPIIVHKGFTMEIAKELGLVRGYQDLSWQPFTILVRFSCGNASAFNRGLTLVAVVDLVLQAWSQR